MKVQAYVTRTYEESGQTGSALACSANAAASTVAVTTCKIPSRRGAKPQRVAATPLKPMGRVVLTRASPTFKKSRARCAASPEGHHPHGLEDSTPIVEFIFTHGVARNTAILDRKTTLRVLSYNIHHAEGMDGKLGVARIARVINDCQPDLVALQEVDKLVERTESIDQPSELARLTDMHVIFGANIKLQSGHYGNAVLSRFPVTHSENHLLPCLNNGEQRGVLEASIRLTNKIALRFLATHFDHRSDDAERQQSATAVLSLPKDSDNLPAILAGDLNDTLSSPSLNLLMKHWSRTSEEVQPTVPVTTPDRQIEFVLFRPAARWKVIESRVLDEAIASDHRPILAILALLPEASERP